MKKHGVTFLLVPTLTISLDNRLIPKKLEDGDGKIIGLQHLILFPVMRPSITISFTVFCHWVPS